MEDSIFSRAKDLFSTDPENEKPAEDSFASMPYFKEGDKIEARYRGGSRYFSGIISKKNEDGTFAVDYDDGSHEKTVISSLIRKLKLEKEVN